MRISDWSSDVCSSDLKVGWREVLSIVQSFEDERLRCFGLRLVYFEHRSVLPEEIRLRVERELTDRLVEEESGGLTLRRALQETDALLGSDYTETNGILADYRAYLVARITRVSHFRHSISRSEERRVGTKCVSTCKI